MSNKRNRDKKSGQPERRPCAVDTHPTTCNLCGGQVIYTSNERVYGRKYGSGYCYLCTCCGAYVGTHEPRPRAFWPTAVCAREKSCATLCLTRCGGASRRRAGSGTPSMNGWPDRWGSPLRTAILGTLTFSSCVRRTGCSQMSRGFPCGMITVGAFSLKSAAQPDRQRHSNGSDRSLR